MGLAETAELAVRISLKDNVSGGIRKLQGNLNGLNRSLAQTGRGVGQIGTGLTRAGLVVGGAAIAGLVAAAKAGADFEAQLKVINTIARATPTDLTAIGDGIRTLAREGKGDLSDLSAGFYDILSAGITNAADAQKVLQSATTLAMGSLSTNAEAVDLLTTAINAYGQEASAAQADADLFAKAVEIGKVKADEIAASFAQVAPIAAQVGINIEEVAAAYGALTAQGTPAAEVATQMQRSIIELLNPSADLIKLQEKLGVSFLQIAKDKGLVVALQAMRDGVGDNDSAFKALFGRVEAYKFALQTTGPQNKIYNDALAAMADSAGTASEQMGERTQGLAFQVKRFTANLQDAGITLSNGFLPALGRSIDRLSEFLGLAENRKQLTAIGEDIGRAIDGINWADVLTGATKFVELLKGALTFAKLMFDAFMALPGPIKEATAGFLVLNKLSGNLLASGAGNVVGGLAGSVAQGLGSRLPGTAGRLFAQPVFVTNWAMMAGGGLGGAAGAAGAASIWSKVGTIIGGAFAIVAIASIAEEVHKAISPGGGLQGRTDTGTLLPADELQWPFGPKNTPKWVIDSPFGPINVLGGDSGFAQGGALTGNLGRNGPARRVPSRGDLSSRGLGNAISSVELANILKRGQAAGFSPSANAVLATNNRNLTRLAAIAARPVVVPAPKVDVVVNVSPTGLVTKQIYYNRAGPTGGSREFSSRLNLGGSGAR